MTTEVLTRKRRTTSTTSCLMWPQTWSMWTRTSTPTEDSWVPFVCLSVVSLLSCYCFSLYVEWFPVHTLWLKFVPCSSHRHRHVSCARWVILSPTSPSTSLSFSSFLLASRTSFCSSSSLSVMSWTKTTRTAAEELGPPDCKNSSTVVSPLPLPRTTTRKATSRDNSDSIRGWSAPWEWDRHPHRREQDRVRRCRLQAKKVLWDFEWDEERAD